MKTFPLAPDKLAIAFSTLCVFHCLALPLLMVLLPSLTTLPLEQELFHVWMVIAVIPTSLYALTLGCKRHKHFLLVIYGFIGLFTLIAALFVGDMLLGEVGEKLLTVIGAIIIAIVHFKNYRLCQQSKECPCPK